MTLNVVDDFNHEGLGIEVDFSLAATRVTRALDQIIEWRGTPLAIRVDTGPEYISGRLHQWAEKRGIAIQPIQRLLSRVRFLSRRITPASLTFRNGFWFATSMVFLL